MKRLTDKQSIQLQEALIDAFPTRAELAQMVKHQLDQNLEQTTAGGTLSDVVLSLINWAEARGRTVELIAGVLKHSPQERRLTPGFVDLLVGLPEYWEVIGKFCSRCGSQNSPTAHLCIQCGSVLERARGISIMETRTAGAAGPDHALALRRQPTPYSMERLLSTTAQLAVEEFAQDLLWSIAAISVATLVGTIVYVSSTLSLAILAMVMTASFFVVGRLWKAKPR